MPFRAVLLAAFLSCLGAEAPVRGDTLLVVPFEAIDVPANLLWMNEAFSESLARFVERQGLQVVGREERLEILETFGLREGRPLSRATLIRVAEEVGADWVVAGQFRVRGRRLQAEVRLLHLAGLRMTPPLSVEGEISGLFDVSAALCWQLLREMGSPTRGSYDSFRSGLPQLSLSAFESYLRGHAADSTTQREQYWLQAARLSPDFAPPAFYLGRFYLTEGDWGQAVQWLTRALESREFRLEARFYLSVAQFYSGDPAAAARTLSPLAQETSSAEVWNNLAVFGSRAGLGETENWFEQAAAADEMNPDVHFNLGLHRFRQRKYDDAANALFAVLELNPLDTEARFLLAKVLEGQGREEEAQSVEQQAVGDNPALKLSLERRRFELDRVAPVFHAADAHRTLRQQSQDFRLQPVDNRDEGATRLEEDP